ncbi:MAG TPA: CBS domain-containing protein [Thermoanaerobaculia bacterium]
MRQIADIIEGKTLFFVGPTESVRGVARKMAEKNIGAIAVLEEGTLVGLFSERDLMKRVVAENVDPDKAKVADVMTRELAVASPQETIPDCVQRMHSLGCRHLPVVDRGKLVGMISLRDLLEVDSETSKQKANFLTELVTYSPDYES